MNDSCLKILFSFSDLDQYYFVKLNPDDLAKHRQHPCFFCRFHVSSVFGYIRSFVGGFEGISEVYGNRTKKYRKLWSSIFPCVFCTTFGLPIIEDL